MSNSRANPFAQNTHVRRPLIARDAFGRELVVGDEVTLPNLRLFGFRVQEIRPALEPGAPPNTMVITVGAQIRMVVAADQRVPEMVRLRTNAELVAAGAPAPEPPDPTDADPDLSSPLGADTDAAVRDDDPTEH